MELELIMHKLMIVEDDKRLATLIATFFERSGFNVSVYENGQNAIENCESEAPDIIVLDLNLPDTDGISVCSQLRKFYQGRILILTAFGNDMDQIDGFEMGADDFVTKPVEPRVLLARIKALLRRDAKAQEHDEHILSFGQLHINFTARQVSLNRKLVHLTSHEFELLSFLVHHAGEVLSRNQLYKKLKGFGYDGMDRAIDIKISRLRKKLDDDANNPSKIKTIWGKGYLFVPSAWEN